MLCKLFSVLKHHRAGEQVILTLFCSEYTVFHGPVLGALGLELIFLVHLHHCPEESLALVGTWSLFEGMSGNVRNQHFPGCSLYSLGIMRSLENNFMAKKLGNVSHW